MNALTRYLNRLFFARLTLLLFGIVSVVISFDLLERSDNVLSVTGGGPLILIQYAMLRAPDIRPAVQSNCHHITPIVFL